MICANLMAHKLEMIFLSYLSMTVNFEK